MLGDKEIDTDKILICIDDKKYKIDKINNYKVYL